VNVNYQTLYSEWWHMEYS